VQCSGTNNNAKRQQQQTAGAQQNDSRYVDTTAFQLPAGVQEALAKHHEGSKQHCPQQPLEALAAFK
jgi:hypothetical protein